jgi:LysM repeat protein/murein endopeptidase
VQHPPAAPLVQVAAAPTPAPAPVAAPVVAPAEEVAAAAPVPAAVDDDDDDTDPDADVPEEGESHDAAPAVDPGLLYTADVPDDDLQHRWSQDPSSLGSISLGFVDEGRLVNAQPFPRDPAWIVVSPDRAYATQETIDYVVAAIRAVRADHPQAPPLRVNQISAREGGWIRPHRSHQNGRDVDLAFYYPTVEPVRERERERFIDVPLNWALVRALVINADVQMILVDRRVQQVLYDYALSIGEDRAWLDSLFHAGHASILQHARHHRDHFHVRFFNPRAQELGRRVAPLLAQRPEHNVRTHRVRHGDTLGHIAARYGTTVSALLKANHMRASFLSVGRVLQVPLRGPCTHCPVPPPTVVPPRRLPPPRTDPSDRVAGLFTSSLAPATTAW